VSEERLIQLLEQINEQTQKSTKVVVRIFLFSYHCIGRKHEYQCPCSPWFTKKSNYWLHFLRLMSLDMYCRFKGEGISWTMTHDVAVQCCNVSSLNTCLPGYVYFVRSLGVFLTPWIVLIWADRSLGTLSEEDTIFRKFQVSFKCFYYPLKLAVGPTCANSTN